MDGKDESEYHKGIRNLLFDGHKKPFFAEYDVGGRGMQGNEEDNEKREIERTRDSITA